MTAPRTKTRAEPGPTITPPDRRIDYAFDPVAKDARIALEDGKISRTDYAVFVELISFQKAFKGSCWTAKATIADRLGISTKTVQRSYRQLERANLIRMHQVSAPGFPDPDEPANRTGWRIHFLFVDAVRPIGPASDRRRPAQRKKHACKSGGERTPMSSPPPQRTDESMHVNQGGGEDTHVLPGEDISVPQGSNALRAFRRNEKDDEDPDGNACMSSSSFSARLEEPEPESPPSAERTAGPLPQGPPIPDASTHEVTEGHPAPAIVAPGLTEAAIDQALLAALALRVIALYKLSDRQARAKLVAAYRDAIQTARQAGFRSFNPAWLGAGLDVMEGYKAKSKPFHWGVFMGTLRNFAREDGPTDGKTEFGASPQEAREILASLRAWGCNIVADTKSATGCNSVGDWKVLPESLKRKLDRHKEAIRAEVLRQTAAAANYNPHV